MASTDNLREDVGSFHAEVKNLYNGLSAQERSRIKFPSLPSETKGKQADAKWEETGDDLRIVKQMIEGLQEVKRLHQEQGALKKRNQDLEEKLKNSVSNDVHEAKVKEAKKKVNKWWLVALGLTVLLLVIGAGSVAAWQLNEPSTQESLEITPLKER